MRKPLTNKQRFDIFKRDGFTCQYCGAHGPGTQLQIDHIEPVAKGGQCESGNFLTACKPCNSGKAANSVLPELKHHIEDIFNKLFNPNRCFQCSELVSDDDYDQNLVYFSAGEHVPYDLTKWNLIIPICVGCIEAGKKEVINTSFSTFVYRNDSLLQEVERLQALLNAGGG